MTTTNSTEFRLTADTNPFTVSSTLADSAYLLSAVAIDNRENIASAIMAGDLADLQLICSAFTATAGGFLTLSVFDAVDGGTTNYASPNAATLASTSSYRATYSALNASATVINIGPFPINPYSQKLHLYSKLGVTITITSSLLQRRTRVNF